MMMIHCIIFPRVTGRAPNTKRLNLEAVGVELDHLRAVKVSSFYLLLLKKHWWAIFCDLTQRYICSLNALTCLSDFSVVLEGRVVFLKYVSFVSFVTRENLQ